MKRFDERNASLGVAEHEQTGICPACRLPCKQIFSLYLPWSEETLLGCGRCTTAGELAGAVGGLLDLEAVERGWVEQ